MVVNSMRHGFLCNNSGLQIFGKLYDIHNKVAYITCNDKIITFLQQK